MSHYFEDDETHIQAQSYLQEAALESVGSLLRFIGENPEREGLRDTPRRVCKAWAEMTSGYAQDAREILATSFGQNDCDATPYDGMIVLRDIEFCSICEHHMLPFEGVAHIGYIPGASGRIVGLSKLARLVECYARRLQVQERLTSQIADALQLHLQPAGAIVMIEASHSCMKIRGVGKQNSTMITSALRGVFESDEAARAEALGIIGKSRG